MDKKDGKNLPHKEIGIGLLGLGVIGSEFASTLINKSKQLERKIGLPIKLSGVLVKNIEKVRSVDIPKSLLTTDKSVIINNPNTHILVEVIGGTTIAASAVREALQAGIHVITANKELLAKFGPELHDLASANDVAFHYEAAVGGGIPLVATLNRALIASRVTTLRAIINGTTNYILSEMSKNKLSFSKALKQAQDLGYAEPDPTSDIDGSDAAFKLAILTGIAFDSPIDYIDIYKEGIGDLAPNDFMYADELGYSIKLLAIAKRQDDNSIDARVHPVLLNKDTPLAKVDGVLNAIEVSGDLIGQVLLYGEGAGAQPTTNSILSDLFEIARNLSLGNLAIHSHQNEQKHILYPNEQITVRYNIRMLVSDEPVVMSKITQVLAQKKISIASVIQRETSASNKLAEVVIMTHKATENELHESIAELKKLIGVNDVSTVIRLEE